jgi:hypothetical protein
MGNKETNTEVIARISAGGGDLTLIGQKSEAVWRFRLEAKDCSAGFLDEDDAAGLPTGATASPWVDTWADAVALLDRYPWAELYPRAVHPEFREQVWKEVKCRIDDRLIKLAHKEESEIQRVDNAQRTRDRWRKLCDIRTDDYPSRLAT